MQAPRGAGWRPIPLSGMQEEVEGHKGLIVRKALSELESTVHILVITHLGPNRSEKQKGMIEKKSY